MCRKKTAIYLGSDVDELIFGSKMDKMKIKNPYFNSVGTKVSIIERFSLKYTCVCSSELPLKTTSQELLSGGP